MPKSKTDLNSLLYDLRRIEEHREVLTEKKIKAIYQSLTDELDIFLAKGYKQYADSDGRLFTAYLDAQRKTAWFLNEIVKNVDIYMPSVTKEITNLINKSYEECYKGIVEAVKKADTAEKLSLITKDIGVNPQTLKRAVNNNISKLTLPPVMEKHRAEVIYQIQQELGIGLMNGDRYETMANRISERLGMCKDKAMNITRTETHRNIEGGLMDGAEHISKKIEGSDLIYAVTWITRRDERVRPQQRRKTSKGWKTTLSKSGANHIKMDGKTVKVGELFDLGYLNGEKVTAKAPSHSGKAAHDCNCRCFLQYDFMTVEEFAKATNQTEEEVRSKYNMSVNESDLTEKGNEPVIELEENTNDIEKVELKLSDYPTVFTKGAEGKNTQKLIDYVNSVEGADPNVLKLYASTGKLENFTSQGIPFKISHAKDHAISVRSFRSSGEITEVKYIVPKLKGKNIAGQVNTTLHEQMHLLDMFGRENPKTNSKWFSVGNKKLVDTFKNTTDEIGDEIAELFKKHNAEYEKIKKAMRKSYDEASRAAKEKYLPNGMSPWEDFAAYKQYEKEAKKLLKQMYEDMDYECRNIMGSGICNLQDIYDALSSGTYRANGVVIYGHGQQYYLSVSNQIKEVVANYASLSVTRPDLIEMLRKDKPELCEALDNMIKELVEKAGV